MNSEHGEDEREHDPNHDDEVGSADDPVQTARTFRRLTILEFSGARFWRVRCNEGLGGASAWAPTVFLSSTNREPPR